VYCEFPKIKGPINTDLVIDAFSSRLFHTIKMLEEVNVNKLCKLVSTYRTSIAKDVIYRVVKFELERHSKPYKLLTTVGKKGDSLLRVIHTIRVTKLIQLVMNYFPITHNDNFQLLNPDKFMAKYPSHQHTIYVACDLVNQVRNRYCFSIQDPNSNLEPMSKLKQLQESELHGTNRQFAETLASIHPEEIHLVQVINGNYWLCLWKGIWMDPWLGRVFPDSHRRKKIKNHVVFLHYKIMVCEEFGM